MVLRIQIIESSSLDNSNRTIIIICVLFRFVFVFIFRISLLNHLLLFAFFSRLVISSAMITIIIIIIITSRQTIIISKRLPVTLRGHLGATSSTAAYDFSSLDQIMCSLVRITHLQ